MEKTEPFAQKKVTSMGDGDNAVSVKLEELQAGQAAIRQELQELKKNAGRQKLSFFY